MECFLLNVMRNLFFYLKSYIFGEHVGTDHLGNKYYCHRKNKKKRWVLYSGLSDASKITPQWHGWIHGNNEIPLEDEDLYSWQKEHLPNLTGTVAHHVPKKTNINAKHKPGYESWRP
ncbi:MAG: hypothetical protein HEEMFOPI_00349 [Holosporales bacterium]